MDRLMAPNLVDVKIFHRGAAKFGDYEIGSCYYTITVPSFPFRLKGK
jgi:hypothetical protein